MLAHWRLLFVAQIGSTEVFSSISVHEAVGVIVRGFGDHSLFRLHFRVFVEDASARPKRAAIHRRGGSSWKGSAGKDGKEP